MAIPQHLSRPNGNRIATFCYHQWRDVPKMLTICYIVMINIYYQ